MALTAEHFVIIGRGKLIADVTAAELEAMATEQSVRVRTPDATRLRDVLSAEGVGVRSDERGVLTVTGLRSDDIGVAAAQNGLTLYELVPQQSSLEEIFMELTHDSVQYRAGVHHEASQQDPTQQRGVEA
jgi:ABC-2 type transport system ATP-binding protein